MAQIVVMIPADDVWSCRRAERHLGHQTITSEIVWITSSDEK